MAAGHGAPPPHPPADVDLGFRVSVPRPEPQSQAADDSLAARTRESELAFAELMADEEAAPGRADASKASKKPGGRQQRNARR